MSRPSKVLAETLASGRYGSKTAPPAGGRLLPVPDACKTLPHAQGLLAVPAAMMLRPRQNRYSEQGPSRKVPSQVRRQRNFARCAAFCEAKVVHSLREWTRRLDRPNRPPLWTFRQNDHDHDEATTFADATVSDAALETRTRESVYQANKEAGNETK